MIRDQSKRDARAVYVRKVVGRSTSISEAVTKLSKQLFISERTIWRDLQRPYD